MTKYINITIIILLILALNNLSFGTGENKEIHAIKKFIEKHVSIIKPLYKEASLASWNASISGKEEDYSKSSQLQYELEKVYTNKEEFKKIKEWKKLNIKDPILKRQIDLLYLEYLQNQIPDDLLKKIISKSNEVEKLFNTFRGKVDGKEVSMNEIEEVLRNSLDSKERQKYWEAQKSVGLILEKPLKELVKLRNKAARLLGFPNFYSMSLYLNEQDENDLLKLFDELDKLTKDRFAELKREIDIKLSQRYGIKPEEMMPWHYNDSFFQEAPKIYEVDFDSLLKEQNILDLTEKFFNSIGLQIDDILRRSDLYEKKGKSPHAFETNIDKEGDIRILANIKNNEYWLDTMLHESGHAVYDKYVDKNLPFLLRQYAHISTTEAIAMLFGRLAKNAYWLQKMLNLSDEERKKIENEAFKTLQAQELIFSRWTQVMFRFERELYKNPNQNLNKLWWDLVKKYQLINPPKGRNMPDYASKIHLSTSPAYYHNYLIGELIASQIHHHIVKNILKDNDLKSANYIGNKEVGAYLIKHIFSEGAILKWDMLIEKATGEKLTPKYFAEQFID